MNDTCREETSCSCCALDFFEEKPPLWKQRTILTALAAGGLLAAGLLVKFLTPLNTFAQILFVSVVLVAGRSIMKAAYRSVLQLRLDMNCLMSLAALGAFMIGHGEEGAAVILLFFIAESLEGYAADKAQRSMGQLLNLAPETAQVKRGEQELKLHVHEIAPGETVVIRPGEKIPLDGRVITGHSSVNESSITGESIPVEKQRGDEALAGTMNEEGYLEIRVSRKSNDSLVSRIIRLVEEAERRKSATEKFIDRFARYYTPAVICLAFIIFLVPPLFFAASWTNWFYRALLLLVVSCPCALAISTPVAMVSAITSAARHGVLIKGAGYLEELSRTATVAFDKTGTLTKGKLEVTDVVGLNNHTSREVLQIAASLEILSEHPIAKAIVKESHGAGLDLRPTKHFTTLRGKGLKGNVEGITYYVGKQDLFEMLPLTLPEEVRRFDEEGRTTVIVSDERQIIGIIALADRMRKKAPLIINHLKKSGLRTVMLTGDNERVSRSLAESIGIDEYHAGLLPGDKVDVIRRLTSRGGSVAMVGDGVNDAPALAAAKVGIAMADVGTDVAMETADIALIHGDLTKIDYLLTLSRTTMKVVKQNIIVALTVKGSLTLLAVLGMINLWIAVGVGDMGLSLAVILNAMRLTRVKP